MEENRNRKRRSRRAFVKDFKADESGNYKYSGRVLQCSLELSELRRRILRAAAVFGAVIALQIAAGFLPGTGMEGHILMLLPYALGLAAAIRIVYILVRILRRAGQPAAGGGAQAAGRGGEEKTPELREYVCEATVGKLPVCFVAIQVFAGTALTDAAVCMIRGTYIMSRPPAVTVFILSQLLLLAAGAWGLRSDPVGEWR